MSFIPTLSFLSTTEPPIDDPDLLYSDNISLHHPDDPSLSSWLDSMDRHLLLLFIAVLCVIYTVSCTFLGLILYEKLSPRSDVNPPAMESKNAMKMMKSNKIVDIDIESGLVVKEHSNSDTIHSLTATHSATTIGSEVSEGTIDEEQSGDAIAYLRFSTSTQSVEDMALAITSDAKWQRQISELQDALGINTHSALCNAMTTNLMITERNRVIKVHDEEDSENPEDAEDAVSPLSPVHVVKDSSPSETGSTESYSSNSMSSSQMTVIRLESPVDSGETPSEFLD